MEHWCHGRAYGGIHGRRLDEADQDIAEAKANNDLAPLNSRGATASFCSKS
ncbi:UNVERIFIED_CONTAM: hypothetical protein DES50_10650 [Williamsia faeni]